MGYERNDRRYGYGYGRDYDRPERAGRYGGYDDPQDRGFFERAGDEIRSWFGDDEAERRRRIDERYDERYDRDYPRNRYEGDRDAGYRASGSGGPEAYPRWNRSNQSEAYRGGGYARGYAPTSGDFAKPSDIRRTGADFGGGTRPYGYSSYADDSYGYASGGDDSWRRAEYRALYGERDRDEDQYGYRSWRHRQISSLDRDYDEYRRENQSRFESEFSAWRQNRQGQRESLQKVQEHQDVVGSDGVHVGKVDHVRGDRILLAKSDRDAGGHHHSIPSSWIQSVDEQVHLVKTAEQAKQAWRDEDEGRGLFGRSGDEDEDWGRANLNRSFSGTY